MDWYCGVYGGLYSKGDINQKFYLNFGKNIEKTT
jgi:hypothetical protein